MVRRWERVRGAAGGGVSRQRRRRARDRGGDGDDRGDEVTDGAWIVASSRLSSGYSWSAHRITGTSPGSFSLGRRLPPLTTRPSFVLVRPPPRRGSRPPVRQTLSSTARRSTSRPIPSARPARRAVGRVGTRRGRSSSLTSTVRSLFGPPSWLHRSAHRTGRREPHGDNRAARVHPGAAGGSSSCTTRRRSSSSAILFRKNVIVTDVPYHLKR